MNIYLQVGLGGIVFGNGGYIALTALYDELARQGHTVYFFDPYTQISIPTKLVDVRPQSSYLGYEDLLVVGLPFVCEDQDVKVIIALWMTPQLYEIIVGNCWESSFVWWGWGQLIRKGEEAETKRVLSLLAKSGMPFLLCNRYLEPIFREHLDLKQVLYLDAFVRADLFHYDMSMREPGVIGYQPEARPDQSHLQEATARVTEHLENYVGQHRLVFCMGTHREVAEKMKRCDIFLWHNTADVNNSLLSGETVGLAMIEALASGCVVIARKNYFTQQIFPEALLCSSLEEGTQILGRLLADPDEKEKLRGQCLAIARNYHFDGFGGDRIRTLNRVLGIET